MASEVEARAHSQWALLEAADIQAAAIETAAVSQVRCFSTERHESVVIHCTLINCYHNTPRPVRPVLTFGRRCTW